MCRLRFQFRLRMLFVVVTLFSIPCAYVGWQAKIVAQRKAMLNALSKEFVTGDYPGIFYIGKPKSSISIVRRWLGDEAIPALLLPKGLPPDKLDQIQAVFPESRLITTDDLGPPSTQI